jgi:hypothetical protein
MLLGTIAAIDAHEFHFNMLNWNPTLLAKSPPDGSDETVLLLPARPRRGHRRACVPQLDVVRARFRHLLPHSQCARIVADLRRRRV